MKRSSFFAPIMILMLSPAAPAWADETAAATPQDQQAPPINVFEGRVLDHEGKPVAEAAVAVARAGEGFLSYNGGETIWAFAPEKKFWLFFTTRNGLQAADTTTDDEGRFRIEALHAGKYNLIAAHDQRGIAVLTGVEQPNQGNPLDVKLQPPTFIEGSIRRLRPSNDEAYWYASVNAVYGQPWPWEKDMTVAAALSIQPSSFGGSDTGSRVAGLFENLAGALGAQSEYQVQRFRLGPLPAGGTYAVQQHDYVSKRSFAGTALRLPVKVELGKTARIDIDLTTGEHLDGSVVGPDGKPLAEVAVSIKDANDVKAMENNPRAIVREYGAITDDKGQYKIYGAAAGSYVLEAIRYAARTGPG